MKTVSQAGAVIFRTDNDLQFLIVRAKKNPSDWIFPKGHVEPGESRAQTALRETAEEAGVTGEIVCGLCPEVEFKQGNELISVRYYLLWRTGDVPAHEQREKRWVSPAEAKTLLTHEESRILVDQALKRIAPFLNPTPGRAVDGDFRELLKTEYEHIAESLLRNEEDGEKRAGFLITLNGGVGAIVGFLLHDKPLDAASVEPLVVLAAIVLLLIGHLTFLRIISRNIVTDQYKEGLNRIRRYFVRSPGEENLRYLPFDPFTDDCRKPLRWISLGKGGWLETVAAVQSLLAGILAATLIPTSSWWYDGLIGAFVSFAAWILLIDFANSRYRKMLLK